VLAMDGAQMDGTACPRNDAGGREVRRTRARSNGFAYFPRKESRSPVRGETLESSHRDNGYVPHIKARAVTTECGNDHVDDQIYPPTTI